MRVFNLPDLGEGLQEATVVEWHVKPGDALAADQAMVSVETDKAIVEVPAPFDGQVEKLFAQPGDTVHVGAPLVGFQGEGQDRGAIVGDLAIQTKHEAKATPAVRSLARSLSVDLASVKGTGPGGIATAEDVKRAARGGLRQAMAKNMAASHAAVVPVTLTDDADVEHWPAGTKPLARLARAVVAACQSEPGLNAWYEDDKRRSFAEVHLGIAVDLPDGLLVPVLRNADRGISEDDLFQFLERAKKRQLPPAELRGATITLSNYGSIGGRYATPLVVPPMVAIAGFGSIKKRPVVTAQGELKAHRVVPISLSFDHRAATGGEATRFLNALIADLRR
ncbi:MAG: dihydrolipoamide acetyltransferase family protein [Betaproteobacteria bacterium]